MISIYVHKYLRLAFGREPSKSESISGNDSIKPHQTRMRRNSFSVFSGVRKMCRDLETFPGLNEKAMAKAALAISRVWGFCRHESSERGPDIYLISLMKLNDFCWRVAHFHFCIELYIVYSPDHKHLNFSFIYLLCVGGDCWWCVYTTAYVCRSEVSSHFLPCGFWGLNSGH